MSLRQAHSYYMAINVDVSTLYDARNWIPVEMAHICVGIDRCTHAHSFCTSCFVFAVCRLFQVPCVLERESDFTCLSFLVSCIFSYCAHTHSQLQVSWHPLNPIALHCVTLTTRDSDGSKDKHMCSVFALGFFLKLGLTTKKYQYCFSSILLVYILDIF